LSGGKKKKVFAKAPSLFSPRKKRENLFSLAQRESKRELDVRALDLNPLPWGKETSPLSSGKKGEDGAEQKGSFQAGGEGNF